MLPVLVLQFRSFRPAYTAASSSCVHSMLRLFSISSSIGFPFCKQSLANTPCCSRARTAVSRSSAHKRVTSDTFCQGCLRTFFAVIQNQTLDFVAHGFFARFTEMDFDAVGGLSDFLYHYRWRGFLYGQRGSGCGGAAVAGVVVHRLSFP